MPLILLLLIIPAVLVILTPLLLVQRYRVGISRRPARRWIALVATISGSVSAVVILVSAAFTNIWVANTLRDAALGLVIGGILGLAGVATSRWESGLRALHYTPNRWFVLLITVAVTARILFGLYRLIIAVQSGSAGGDLVTAFGVAESLGAGAMIVSYYVAYNSGVIWKIRRWQRRPLKPA